MDKSGNFGPFLDWWHALPRDSHPFLPSKNSCKPASLGKMTSNIALFEYRGAYDMICLFIGSEIERLSGLKTPKSNYYLSVAPHFRDALHSYHQTIFGKACGAYIGDIITLPSGKQFLFETLQFPLSDEEGNVRFLLAYGYGRITADGLDTKQKSMRAAEDRQLRNIKELHYMDLGGGAPKSCIIDFKTYSQPPTKL